MEEVRLAVICDFVDYIKFTHFSDVDKCVAGILAGEIPFPSNGSVSADPCQEVQLLGKKIKKPEPRHKIKKLKMKKSVEDMTDGKRYIVYYEFS